MAPTIPGAKALSQVRAATKEVMKDLRDMAKDSGLLEKTCRLHDLVQAVRKCKTAAEERALIATEAAAMRAEFRESARCAAPLPQPAAPRLTRAFLLRLAARARAQDAGLRPRAVAKLMFMHMLGYPTHFGQMETLKLISSPLYPEKRMGYLGLTLLLDERAEVLLLVTNSLKNDLCNVRAPFVAALALHALGAVASPEMARDLALDVERLMGGDNAYLRKKAALCGVRILRKVPELGEGFFAAAPALLRDRHHGVLLAGCAFGCALLEACPGEGGARRALLCAVPDLLRVLQGLASGPSGGEHDVGGVADPFLQVAVLRLLRKLGAGDAGAADAMADALALALAAPSSAAEPGGKAAPSPSAGNAGAAVAYEAARTALGVPSIAPLRALAINALGRFLATSDNNRRYAALRQLAGVAASSPAGGADGAAVQRHRATIVACVRDADVSIRRRALELVYGLVTDGNAAALLPELVAYLAGPWSDADARPACARRLLQLAARHAPTKRWHLDTALAVLAAAAPPAAALLSAGGVDHQSVDHGGGADQQEEGVRAVVVLASNEPALQPYAARCAYRSLSDSGLGGGLPPGLGGLCVWLLGEFGEGLVGPSGTVGTGGTAPPGDLLDGEEPLAVRPDDVAALLEALLRDPLVPDRAKGLALGAAAKLAAKARSAAAAAAGGAGGAGAAASLAAAARLAASLVGHRASPVLELQQRSCELGAMVGAGAGGGGGGGGAAAAEGAAAAAAAAAAAGGALDTMPPPDEAAWRARALPDAPPPPSAGRDDDGGGGGVGTAPAAAADGGGARRPAGAAPAAAAAAAQPPAASALSDLLGSFDDDPAPPPPPPAAAAATAAFAALELLGGDDAAQPPQPPPAAAAAAAAHHHPPPPAAATAPAGPVSLGAPSLAFSRAGVSVSFEAVAPDPVGAPGTTRLTALFANASASPATSFVLHAAVPKYCSLAMAPASTEALAPGGAPGSQLLTVVNAAHGAKPLALRLKVEYDHEGQRVEEVVTWTHQPGGAAVAAAPA